MTRKERKHWGQINDLYMSEESDDGEGSFRVHSPSWRSQKLENFIQELDSRQKRKLFKKPRIQSTPLVGSPPKNAPAWTVQNQGMPNTAATPAVAEVEDFSLSQSQHRPLQPVLQFPVGSSQGMYSNSSLNYTTPPPQNGYAAEVSYCMLHISAFSVLLQGYMQWSPSSEEYQQISRAMPYYEGGIGLPRSTESLPTSGSLGNQSTTPTRPASVRSRNQVVNDIFSDSDS
ncbi:uncharacterized protein [Dysidea avara]|uniref:uncharacterized protein isoform X2 n=1 Tax=Dysidea avara TaxID=196820 RepID=UPI003328D81F